MSRKAALCSSATLTGARQLVDKIRLRWPDGTVRAEIERIRRRTDDRIACDRRRIEAFYYGAPERERNEILAQVLRRDREEEDREA